MELERQMRLYERYMMYPVSDEPNPVQVPGKRTTINSVQLAVCSSCSLFELIFQTLAADHVKAAEKLSEIFTKTVGILKDMESKQGDSMDS